MYDLISRQAAIDALAKFVPYAICDESTESYANGLTDAYNLICQLPSAQPEPQWIPCSERLPKPFEHCLWTTTDGRVVYHHCDGLFSNYTAWMPLPEPWRGEEYEI